MGLAMGAWAWGLSLGLGLAVAMSICSVVPIGHSCAQKQNNLMREVSPQQPLQIKTHISALVCSAWPDVIAMVSLARGRPRPIGVFHKY